MNLGFVVSVVSSHVRDYRANGSVWDDDPFNLDLAASCSETVDRVIEARRGDTTWS